MAGSNGNLELGNIWFDGVAANAAVMQIVQENLEACAQELAETIKG